MAKIKRKRGGFPTHNKLLQTSDNNSRGRPGLCVHATNDSLLQPKEKGITQNSVAIISSIGNRNLEKQRR